MQTAIHAKNSAQQGVDSPLSEKTRQRVPDGLKAASEMSSSAYGAPVRS